MFSKQIALFTLLATSAAVASADFHVRRDDEITTTSTEYVYVTITQTFPLSDGEVPTTVTITPPITTETSETTSTAEETLEVLSTTQANSTWTTSYVSGSATPSASNETTFSTSSPSAPGETDDSSATGVVVKTGMMAVVGAAVAFLL